MQYRLDIRVGIGRFFSEDLPVTTEQEAIASFIGAKLVASSIYQSWQLDLFHNDHMIMTEAGN